MPKLAVGIPLSVSTFDYFVILKCVCGLEQASFFYSLLMNLLQLTLITKQQQQQQKTLKNVNTFQKTHISLTPPLEQSATHRYSFG